MHAGNHVCALPCRYLRVPFAEATYLLILLLIDVASFPANNALTAALSYLIRRVRANSQNVFGSIIWLSY